MNRRVYHVFNVASGHASWWIALGQWSFAFFIAICVALHPGLVLKANEGGMSNYGVHLKTALPYSLAMVLAAGCALRGRYELTSRTTVARHFKVLIGLYSALILLTLVSTYGYTLDEPLKITHIAIGVAIMTFETAASLWMTRVLHALYFVLAIQLTGFAIAALTFFGALHLLFLSQIVSGVAFAVLFVRTASSIASDRSSDRHLAPPPT